jgi:hypothetical protein
MSSPHLSLDLLPRRSSRPCEIRRIDRLAVILRKISSHSSRLSAFEALDVAGRSVKSGAQSGHRELRLCLSALTLTESRAGTRVWLVRRSVMASTPDGQRGLLPFEYWPWERKGAVCVAPPNVSNGCLVRIAFKRLLLKMSVQSVQDAPTSAFDPTPTCSASCPAGAANAMTRIF